VVGNQLGVRFENPRLLAGPFAISVGPMLDIGLGLVLDHLRTTHIRAQAGPDRATILVEPTSLSHELEVLPEWIRLDPKRTKLALKTGTHGDLTVKLDSPTAPCAARATPASDVVVQLDEAALRAVMTQAVGHVYDLKSLKLYEDGLVVKGKTEYKPVSAVMTTAKAFLILNALAGGNRATLHQIDTSAVSVKGPLDLEVRIKGGKLHLKPKPSAACGELMKLIQGAGLPASLERGTITIALADAERLVGAELRRLRIGPDGVNLQADLDVEQLIRKPSLRRE
jgi:hypothetical protein